MTANSCQTCKWYQLIGDQTTGECRRFPMWRWVEKDHYCGEHRSKDDPIANPQDQEVS